MKEDFFGIKYLFEKVSVRKGIDDLVKNGDKGYVCVADGVSLSMVQHSQLLQTIFSQASIITCDSGWVPMFIRWIYKINREQYTGSDLLYDIVQRKKYKMMFLGSEQTILQSLQKKLSIIDTRISGMSFIELPFCNVEEFNYPAIAKQINDENPDIIWISLGLPKQEIFMYNIITLITRGVLIGVGAAFKFHSGLSNYKRAPQWLIKLKLEWLYRIFSEPKKQITRCWLIFNNVPKIIYKEYKLKKNLNV